MFSGVNLSTQYIHPGKGCELKTNMQSSIPCIHALIPARGGSKSIPRKNIKEYREKPLLVHSIELALSCTLISRVVVSTDDVEIQKIAKAAGAEAPFLRPSHISGDHAVDFDCFQHYYSWLKFAKQEAPDVIVHLRATYPERSPTLLNKCIKTFLKHRDSYDSLRTVVPIEKSPFKMYLIEDEQLLPLFPTFRNLHEPYNNVRQVLPKCYLHNGCIDIVKKETIRHKNSMTGDKIYPYVMDQKETYDLDTNVDWARSLQENEKKKNITQPIPIKNVSQTHSEKVTDRQSKSLPIDIPMPKDKKKKTGSCHQHSFPLFSHSPGSSPRRFKPWRNRFNPVDRYPAPHLGTRSEACCPQDQDEGVMGRW